ncbi:MAG: ABC transporter ATP-binding protein [Euryarchaeota archaeon]|nr:ABC transporter ATP-binding protein [Euryarchaeota archaeon]
MIRVKDLDVDYGDVNVLKKIILDVNKGEFFGIVGPNGSGKTTLLKSLSRILTPSGGVIYLGDRELSTFSYRELAQEIGVVPQETAINFDYTVRDIIMMGRHPHQNRFSSDQKEDFDIVDHAMELTNTSEFRDRSINEISGGERQRVIIARALAQQPEVLLLDEATSHLDISHQTEILNIIRHLEGEVTIVAVFHDLNLAAYYCDRLILMNEGEIHAIGTPNVVFTRINIKNVFNINVIVTTNSLTGKPTIIPLMDEDYKVPDNPDADGTKPNIHIICGGGTGTGIMYLLKNKGFLVTAGVLSVNDTDYETAMLLDIPVVSEPPFSSVTSPSLDRLKECLKNADYVIVTAMPFSDGNVGNIQVLRNFVSKPICLFKGPEKNLSELDFTGGKATSILKELELTGAEVVHNHKDIFRMLSNAKSESNL